MIVCIGHEYAGAKEDGCPHCRADEREFNIFTVVRKGEQAMARNGLCPPFSLKLSPHNMALAKQQISAPDAGMAFPCDDHHSGAVFRIGDTYVFEETEG